MAASRTLDGETLVRLPLRSCWWYECQTKTRVLLGLPVIPYLRHGMDHGPWIFQKKETTEVDSPQFRRRLSRRSIWVWNFPASFLLQTS